MSGLSEDQRRTANAAIIDGRLLEHAWRPDRTFLENLQAVMEEAAAYRGLMFATSEEMAFKAAVACAMLNSQGEDLSWLEEQMRGLNLLATMLQAAALGASMNLEAVELPKIERPYSLRELWIQAKGSIKEGGR